MNTIWMKISHLLASCKEVLVGQLWLIGLLTPLAVLATLGVVSFSKGEQTVFDTSKTILLSEVQLSPVEVARIVSKPLTELLMIKVYSEDEGSSSQAGALVAKLSIEDTLHADGDGVFLTYQPRRNRFGVLTYATYCNTKKNQAMVGLV
jgi:hypothetical protein